MSRTLRRLVGISAAAGLLALPTLPSQAAGQPTASVSVQSASAATSLTVAEALDRQDGSTQTVRGHVVGQPVSSDRVVTGDFPNNYAVAIATDPGETDTARMLYVQVPDGLREQWGLSSNPDVLGQEVEVTGELASYFAHGGMTGTSGITPVSDGGDPGHPGEPEPGDYYDGTEGLTGDELRDELHRIISNQTVLSYDEVWEGIKDVDEDPQSTNDVVLLYSGKSYPKSNNGGGVDDWNREHVWAKSHGDFGTTMGPGTDLHHLRPTDVTVNSSRGNLDFDNGGEPHDEATDCYHDEDSWEPRDEVKGEVARMVFYMAVRYEGADGFADLEVNDQVDNGSAPYLGKLSTLKEWNEADPPSDFEQRRNERIFQNWQGNRNPFVDHPEWVESIF